MITKMSSKDNFSESEDFDSNCSIVQPEVNQHSSNLIVCSTKEELKKIHHRKALDPQYICNLCGRKYSSQSILKIHKIRHRKKDDLPFHCLFCSYKSATKRDLVRHHNQHIGHARQVYKCDLCSKIFKINSSLSEHIKSVHTKETTYQCEKCDFTTERRSTFRIHLSTHCEPKVKIICPICGSCFQNKSNLKNHLLTHADAKPFACNQCDQRFTLSNRLVAHQQAVHAPKAFECETCKKRFPSIHRLNRHTVTHTGERPYKCCFCSHDSNTQGNLLKHVRKVHAMFHFTYKDILIENGQKVDPKKDLSMDEVKKLVEAGKECSEMHLKKLRSKGLTSSSLEQLQQDLHFKKAAQAAVILKMQEKQEKQKKKSNDAPISSETKSKIEKKTRSRKEKQTKNITEGFEISNCDEFILPRIGDGGYIIQSNGGIDGVDVVPMTPAIQVIWNVNVDNSAKKKHSSPNCKKGKADKTSPKKKPRKKNTKAKSPTASGDVIIGHVNLSQVSENLNSPSTIYEDGDHLAFNDKPPMLNHLHENASDFHPTNAVLDTPLDNLHNVDHLVDLEEIESPNTIVVASDGINDFDRMCKTLDLYNQFLPMNEEEAHFMNAIDSSAYKEPGRLFHSKIESQDLRGKDAKEKVTSQFSALEQVAVSSSSRHPSELRNKSIVRPVVKHSSNLKDIVISRISEQGENCRVNGADSFVKNSSATISLVPEEKALVKKVIINCKSNSNNECQIKSSCRSSTFSSIKTCPQGIDQIQPEEVIIVPSNNDEMSKTNLLKSEIGKDIFKQPTREITIKNSLSNYRLINDQMDVMSIAEIKESDRDVVLLIDTVE